MGDMRELFDDLRECDRKRRYKNLEQAKATTALPWRRFTDYHWQLRLRDDPVDYWPTRNKWRWRGKTYHGDCESWVNKKLKNDKGRPHD